MSHKGPIKKFSLINVLQLIAQKGESGILEINTNNHEIKIFIKDGNLIDVKSSSNDFTTKIGSYLTSKEIISKAKLDELLNKQKEYPIRFGKLLINEKILDETKLKEILTEIVKENFIKVLAINNGNCKFRQTVVEYDENEISPLNINNIILEILKDIVEIKFYRKKITSFQVIYQKKQIPQKIVIDETLPEKEPILVNSNIIKMNEKTFTIYNKVNGVNTVSDIIDQTGMPEHSVLKTIYLLAKAQIITINRNNIKSSKDDIDKNISKSYIMPAILVVSLFITGINIYNLKDKNLFSITMDKTSETGKIYYNKQLQDIADLLGKTDVGKERLNLDYSNLLGY